MENSSPEPIEPQSNDTASVAQEAPINTVELEASTPDFKNPASPYTALTEPLREGIGGGESKMRFFGPRFMAIWVMPMAVTGIIMEFLFVGPLKNANPFN